MENREAGMTIEGAGAGPVVNFLLEAFEVDWASAVPHKVNQQYNSTAMAIILDTTPIPVPVTPKPQTNGYIPPVVPVTQNSKVEIFASPDFARQRLLAGLAAARKTLSLFIYQVTDVDLCAKLVSMHKSGIKITLLVSRKIYSETDWKAAQVCYKSLLGAGLVVWETDYTFTYSHQKYWVVDGTDLWMSTGNWSPTDYRTEPPYIFPPYQAAGWRETNRDYNIHVTGNSAVTGQFLNVMSQDYSTGSAWKPWSALEEVKVFSRQTAGMP
jgi:hypothetical protein